MLITNSGHSTRRREWQRWVEHGRQRGARKSPLVAREAFFRRSTLPASEPAGTRAGGAHALDLYAFASPALSLWAIWNDNELLGVGVLKRLSATLGEVKALHTSQAARRQGVGSILLRHLISVGRDATLTRLSLETG